MQDQSVSYTSAPRCACVCAYICVCVCVSKERARKGPDCLQGPPHTDEQGHRSAWQRKERSVFMRVGVYSGERAYSMCVCKEGVSQPAWAYFVSSPHSLPSTSPRVFFFCSLLPPSATCSFLPSFLRTLPPSLPDTHTHTPRRLSFSDSSRRGPGACWWRLHRSVPSCGGGCKHTSYAHTQKHSRTHQIPKLEAAVVEVRGLRVQCGWTP